MIERIETVQRMGDYLPHLLNLFKTHRELFEDDMDEYKFANKLFSSLNDRSNLFFGRIANNRLEFFVCTSSLPYEGKSVKLVWLCFSHPSCREYTYAWLDYCKKYCKLHGMDELRFISYRLTRSYRRFASKIGAKAFSQAYKIDLTKE